MHGCQWWTTYRCHTNDLDQLHMRYLRRIARITCHDRIANTEVRCPCEILKFYRQTATPVLARI